MSLLKYLILVPSYLAIIFLVGYSWLNLLLVRERFSKVEILTVSLFFSYLFMPIVIIVFGLIGFSFNISLVISILLPMLFCLLFRKRRIKYSSKFGFLESIKRNKIYYFILISLFIFQIALTSFAVLNWEVRTETEHIFQYTTHDFFWYVTGSQDVKRSISSLVYRFPLGRLKEYGGHFINWAALSALTDSMVLNAGKIFQIVLSSLIFLAMLILARQIFKRKESIILAVLFGVILTHGLGGIFALYSYLIHYKSNLFNPQSMKAHMTLLYEYSNYNRLGWGYMEGELLKVFHLPDIRLSNYGGFWRNIQVYTITAPLSASISGVLAVVMALYFFIRGLKRKVFQIFAILTALSALLFHLLYLMPILVSLISYYFILPIIRNRKISWPMLFTIIAISLMLVLCKFIMLPDVPVIAFAPRLITNPIKLVIYYGFSLPLAILASFKTRFKGKTFFIWFVMVSIVLANILQIPVVDLPRLLTGSLIAFGVLVAAYVSSVSNAKIKFSLICILVLCGLVGPISAGLVNKYTNRMQWIGIEEVKAGNWIRENTEKYSLFIGDPDSGGRFLRNVSVVIFGERRILGSGTEPGVNIFRSDNHQVVKTLVDKYKIDYVYYGPSERKDFPQAEKLFEKYLEVVYSSPQVKIYKIKPSFPTFYAAS